MSNRKELSSNLGDWMGLVNDTINILFRSNQQKLSRALRIRERTMRIRKSRQAKKNKTRPRVF